MIPAGMKFWSSISVILGGDKGKWGLLVFKFNQVGKLRRTDELGPSGCGDPGSGWRATVIIGRSSSTTLCTLLRNMAEPSAALRSMCIIRSAARLIRRLATGTAALLSVSDLWDIRFVRHSTIYTDKFIDDYHYQMLQFQAHHLNWTLLKVKT